MSTYEILENLVIKNTKKQAAKYNEIHIKKRLRIHMRLTRRRITLQINVSMENKSQ